MIVTDVHEAYWRRENKNTRNTVFNSGLSATADLG